MIKTIHVGYHSSHPSDFSYYRDSSDANWLMIHTMTPAEFYINEKWTSYPENQVVIYPPYASAQYRAFEGSYQNNWVSFQTDEKYIVQSSLPFRSPFQINQPDYFSDLFHMIAIENFFDYEYKEQSIDHLFHLLFNKLAEIYQSNLSTPNREKLLALSLEIQSNPGFHWSVPYMAKRLNISPGYMQSLYRKTFGISCMEDVFNKRIELAKDYLAHSHYTIIQIAEICGYQNPEHFFRQFRNKTSMTPANYRKQFQSETK